MGEVKAWGLGYAFDKPPASGVCQGNTPSGTVGSVFGDPTRHEDGSIKMDMEAQVWRKMPRPGQQDMFLGYWKESVPEPKDLARANQLTGYMLKLADGNDWLIPVVKIFSESDGTHRSNLPAYLDVDDEGKPVAGSVMPIYAHLEELTAPFAEQMFSDKVDDSSITKEDIDLAARTLLQTNYVVDLIEIAAIHLLSYHEQSHQIVSLSIDWPGYLRWKETLKKKEPSLATVGG
jgi:hypothetical protein